MNLKEKPLLQALKRREVVLLAGKRWVNVLREPRDLAEIPAIEASGDLSDIIGREMSCIVGESFMELVAVRLPNPVLTSRKELIYLMISSKVSRKP